MCALDAVLLCAHDLFSMCADECFNARRWVGNHVGISYKYIDDIDMTEFLGCCCCCWWWWWLLFVVVCGLWFAVCWMSEKKPVKHQRNFSHPGLEASTVRVAQDALSTAPLEVALRWNGCRRRFLVDLWTLGPFGPRLSSWRFCREVVSTCRLLSCVALRCWLMVWPSKPQFPPACRGSPADAIHQEGAPKSVGLLSNRLSLQQAICRHLAQGLGKKRQNKTGFPTCWLWSSNLVLVCIRHFQLASDRWPTCMRFSQLRSEMRRFVTLNMAQFCQRHGAKIPFFSCRSINVFILYKILHYIHSVWLSRWLSNRQWPKTQPFADSFGLAFCHLTGRCPQRWERLDHHLRPREAQSSFCLGVGQPGWDWAFRHPEIQLASCEILVNLAKSNEQTSPGSRMMK